MLRLFVFLLIVFPTWIFAQEVLLLRDLPPKHVKLFQTILKDSRLGNYEKALVKINKILKRYPDFAEGYSKKAGILYNLKKENEAIIMLDELILRYPEFDHESFFTRGYILFEQKQYERSHRDFASYLKQNSLDEKRRTRAIQLYNLSFFRDSLIKNPVPFVPIPLSAQINTLLPEYSPSLNIDGSALVFTRRINNQEDLFLSLKDSIGQFSLPVYLENINTRANEGAHCMSADGNMILFTGCDRDILFRGCDLYYSVKRNGEWSKPANIGRMINTPAWESQPSLSADGKTLFFVSDRVGGFGGRDIWYSKKNEKNAWTEPVNIGTSINTNMDDETPFLHPDGITLYWRSNGRLGMGDFDLYTARWNEKLQNWENIRNLGYPINTDRSEGGLVVSLHGDWAYYATDGVFDSPTSKPNLDIFSFPLPGFAKAIPTTFVHISVKDGNTDEPLIASIEIQNINAGSAPIKGESNPSGNFLTPLHGKRKYAVHVLKEGYIYYSDHIDLDSIYSSEKPYEWVVSLFPVLSPLRSAPVVLNNLFFDTGSSKILPESTVEIDRLYDLLFKNPSIHIQIIGHTDNVGKKEDNQLLSLNRAQSVKQALADKGIEPGRILCEGKGEEIPIADNDSIEGRKKNRRTEFVVIPQP